MKYLAFAILLVSACSSPKEEKQVPFRVLNITQDDWAVYEGTILTDGKLDVDAELSLQQTSVGIDANYELQKYLIAKESGHSLTSIGQYSIFYGVGGHDQGVTLVDYNKIKDQKIVIDKTLRPEEMERIKKMQKINYDLNTSKIYFKTMGNEKLIQTDKNFKPLTTDAKYVLYKRSNLFTAEGYVTADSVTSEFFERNTGEKWKLAPLIEYDSIKKVYTKLATERNEGIYLKALAYSIVDEDSTNRAGKSLVIKNILRMEKSSRFNRID